MAPDSPPEADKRKKSYFSPAFYRSRSAIKHKLYRLKKLPPFGDTLELIRHKLSGSRLRRGHRQNLLMSPKHGQAQVINSYPCSAAKRSLRKKHDSLLPSQTAS